MSRFRSDTQLAGNRFNVGCLLDVQLRKVDGVWEYWFLVEWFENYGHRDDAKQAAYYVPTWLSEKEMEGFTGDNRMYYVSKYNDDRMANAAEGLVSTQKIPVPFWLWQERALYMIDPPDDERDWDPSTQRLNASSVISLANKLRNGVQPEKSDYLMSEADSDDMMSDE